MKRFRAPNTLIVGVGVCVGVVLYDQVWFYKELTRKVPFVARTLFYASRPVWLRILQLTEPLEVQVYRI